MTTQEVLKKISHSVEGEEKIKINNQDNTNEVLKRSLFV